MKRKEYEFQDEIPSVTLFQVSYFGIEDDHTRDIRYALHRAEPGIESVFFAWSGRDDGAS